MPARGSRLTLFLACAAAPFMDAFAIASTGMCLADIPLAPALAGASAAFYMLGALAGCSALGSLSDRLGRKPLLAAAPAAAVAASVFLALVPAQAPSGAALPAALLLAGRFLLGFFTAGDFPAAQAMLSEELPKEAGQRALIGMMIAWYAGALFAILAGAVPALATLARAKRKTVLVSTFALMALGLALMAFQPFAGAAILGFVSFAAAYGYQSVLDFIYPAELFSPAVRGSATGAILTVSKTGAAFSAFLFPIGVTAFGSASMAAAGAFVCLAGMLFSLRFAIEPR